MVRFRQVCSSSFDFLRLTISFVEDVSKALFKAVDRNGNGELDLPDVMALAAIVSKLVDRFGTQNVNQQAAQH